VGELEEPTDVQGYSVYEGPRAALGPVPKALASDKEWHRKFPQ